MSMAVLSLLQIIRIFLIYIGITLWLPSVVLRKKLSGYSLPARFMIYITVGNFYIINMVFLLQLLHISNGLTLWVFTLGPAAAAAIKWNDISLSAYYERIYSVFRSFSLGTLRRKTLFLKIRRQAGRYIKRKIEVFFQFINSHLAETILFIGLSLYFAWIYGTNLVVNYGFAFSDIPVHNYWINEMSHNNIFVSGVYPFGFHCLIYYMNAAFGIELYVLLRVFWFVQAAMVHLVLFMFIKLITKGKFSAYIGTGIYLMFDLFYKVTTNRFYASLPQEFGMIFILPSIYFAILFFEQRKKEIGGAEDRRKPFKKSTQYIALYAVCFSLTTAVHFYNTMIAGLFCVALAFGFFIRFVTPKYFLPVLSAFFLSFLLAILPMGVAYISGTPLQDSLRWGLQVMQGEQEGELPGGEQPGEELPGKDPELQEPSEDPEPVDQSLIQRIKDKGEALLRKIAGVGKRSYNALKGITNDQVVYARYDSFVPLHFLFILWLFLCAIISGIQKRYDYAGILASVGFYGALLFLLILLEPVGLPTPMGIDRARSYFVYSMPVIWSVSADALFTMLFGGEVRKWIKDTASFIIAALIAFFLLWSYPLRKPVLMEGLQTNQAIMCLTNIIKENKDFTWTIISANDELNMLKPYGYHYETISLLYRMESDGYDRSLYIPTPYVYVFIEKRPIDYEASYENSGQFVSVEGAEREIPRGQGLSVYAGENRWIVMSKIYEWAKAYHKMYSNEMTVYYEDEEFVCYRIEQNAFRLNNFYIDYGFNVHDNRSE